MANKKDDFSDMSEADMVRLVTHTALVAKASGAEIAVSNGRLKGAPGVMIWIPGFHVEGGEMNRIPQKEAVE